MEHTSKPLSQRAQRALQSAMRWMQTDGYDPAKGEYPEVRIRRYPDRWVIWMTSREASSSWHGCGAGRTLDAAFKSVEDCVGHNECPCSRSSV